MRIFDRSGATRAVELDISKAFNWVWIHKLKYCGISGQVFDLISSFLSNRQVPVVLDWKLLQEYPVNVGVPQGYLLGSTLFLLYTNEITDYVI